jgi:hypothetical protein
MTCQAESPRQPQMLSQAHVLLGQVDAQTGRPREAISGLQMGLAGEKYYLPSFCLFTGCGKRRERDGKASLNG